MNWRVELVWALRSGCPQIPTCTISRKFEKVCTACCWKTVLVIRSCKHGSIKQQAQHCDSTLQATATQVSVKAYWNIIPTPPPCYSPLNSTPQLSHARIRAQQFLQTKTCTIFHASLPQKTPSIRSCPPRMSTANLVKQPHPVTPITFPPVTAQPPKSSQSFANLPA